MPPECGNHSETLAQRLSEVDARIAAKLAQLGEGNRHRSVTRIVVTKNHPIELAQELYQLECRDFGENRDQEAGPKAAEFADWVQTQALGEGPNWHFIGQLQSNKVKNVLEYASSIHSLDRESLLQAITKACVNRENGIDVFIQVNLTDDPGRGGVDPAGISAFAEKVLDSKKLRLMGLMAVASLDKDPRIDFERVAGYASELLRVAPEAKSLSIGMSADYEVALEFGATHLRIGTAITGNRGL